MNRLKKHNREWMPLIALLAPLLLLATTSAAQTGCGGAGTPITLTNVKSGETIGYKLLLIRGKVSDATTQITVSVNGQASTWPAAAGIYKAMATLKKGPNHIVVSAANHQDVCLDVVFQVPQYTQQIKLIYLMLHPLTEDSAAQFLGIPGEPRDFTSLKKRIQFFALLQQSLLGEFMSKAGAGRKSTVYVSDAQGDPVVEVRIGGETQPSIFTADNNRLVRYLDSVYQPQRDDGTRFLVITKGLLNDQVRNFGDGFIWRAEKIYTWPQDASELVSRFTDRRSTNSNGALLPWRFSSKDADPGVQYGATLDGDFGYLFLNVTATILGVPFDTLYTNPVGVRGVYRLSTQFLVRDKEGKVIGANDDMRLSPPSLAGLNASPLVVLDQPVKTFAALPPSAIPGNLLPGLDFRYYQADFDSLPNFGAAVPVSQGVVPRITLEPKKRDANIAFAFTGFLKIARADIYFMQLNSDDGSRLYIDSQWVINNDGTHFPRRAVKAMRLEAGLHRIEIRYFNKDLGSTLDFKWKSSTSDWAFVPDSAFARAVSGSAIQAGSPIASATILIRRGNTALLSLHAPMDLQVELISTAGRHLAVLFAGRLSSGNHRFAIPSAFHASSGFLVARPRSPAAARLESR